MVPQSSVRQRTSALRKDTSLEMTAAGKVMIGLSCMCLITLTHAKQPCKQNKENPECSSFTVSTWQPTLQFANFECLQLWKMRLIFITMPAKYICFLSYYSLGSGGLS